MTRLPSEYLEDLYYDTCAYDRRVLEALVARLGAERLVIGSDYPVGDPDPIGFVRAGIKADNPEELLSRTAERLLSRG
jgi:aminocarboxymuconate-semialdehyde decarboxylase